MLSSFAKIKMLVMDVDGTLTDGRMYFTSSGEQIKAFDAKDGCGIELILPQLGIIPVIITGRESTCVTIRMKQLHVDEVHQGVDNKLKKLDEIKDKYNISYDEVAVIGDDLNDLKLFKACGFSACPADACEDIKSISKIVLTKNGGRGAVREYIEIIRKGMM